MHTYIYRFISKHIDVHHTNLPSSLNSLQKTLGTLFFCPHSPQVADKRRENCSLSPAGMQHLTALNQSQCLSSQKADFSSHW